MCGGKIALFGKALVGAQARGALTMFAMWVGFPSSFFVGGRKKQNKFPSNLHCPVKARSILFSIYNYRICLLFLHLLPTSACMIICVAKEILYQDTPVQPKVIMIAT
jgi:hypothetical protein